MFNVTNSIHPEHLKSSTTDDVECFFSVLRDCVGKNFTLKQVTACILTDEAASNSSLKSVGLRSTLGTVAYSPVLYIYITDTYNFYFYRLAEGSKNLFM